jgi:hypothetical protein
MGIINKNLNKVLFFLFTTGHCIATYTIYVGAQCKIPETKPFVYRPLKLQRTPKERYALFGAYLPIAEQFPGSSLFESLEIDEYLELDDREQKIFQELEQLLNYLKKDVPPTDEKALEVLELAEKELQQAHLEGIGRKGNYASIRAIDELVSVAAHLLKDCSPKHKKNALKKLLLRIPPRMSLMARNYSALPYLENIEKNMKIISQALEIDPNLLTIDRNIPKIDWSLSEFDSPSD